MCAPGPLNPLLIGGLGLLGATLLTGAQPVRRVFFSFHYQRDIWRVNVVRNHWASKDARQAAGYFDGSLWEKARTEGAAKVKKLIDDGLNGSSVTCVLIGAETYQRHWVDYEIFRSIELGKGVFGIKNKDGQADPSAPNPFEYLAYGNDMTKPGKMIPYANYKEGWKAYADADPITSGAAAYLKRDTTPMLSDLFKVYDWVAEDGYNNFASWAAQAATQARR